MASLGEILLWLAFLTGCVSWVSLLMGIRSNEHGLVELGYRGLQSVFFLVSLASVVLISLLINRAFYVKYIYEYTSKDLSLLYTITAFWAGQEGSLLLWELILAIYTWITLAMYRGHPHLPVVASVIGGVHLFFLFLLCFVSGPFSTLPIVPEDGMGLNPLLQNPGMIIHPPLLYLGYVGFTVPFAFAVAALIFRNAGADWIRRTRKWTILSWLFLTAGIVTGGQWAYVELGWGGYWAWDPVENASFIPWAIATAFLHSVMIQQSKGMLKAWNVSLIALTFLFTLFGTFLTRSGVIQSVHSFGESTLGMYFLAFLFMAALFYLYLMLTRAQLLKGENAFEGLLAKETGFLFNNLLFLGLAFATFWGTIFPIISEAVTGKKVTVGPPFYNQVNGPILVGILILTGICPLIAWRRSSPRRLIPNLLPPMLLGTSAWILSRAFIPSTAIGLTMGAGGFVLGSILLDFFKEVRARRGFHPEENLLMSVLALLRLRSRKYGGYAIHLGVVLMAVGVVTSTVLKREVSVTLDAGTTARFAGFALELKEVSLNRLPGKMVAEARLRVTPSNPSESRSGSGPWEIRPAKIFHAKQDQPHTEVDILHFGLSDLYVILAGFENPSEKEGKIDSASLKLIYHPGVNLIWMGFYIILAGGLFTTLVPAGGLNRRTQRPRSSR
jgi:cytochrome c-type biogenesis protein CcmF